MQLDCMVKDDRNTGRYGPGSRYSPSRNFATLSRRSVPRSCHILSGSLAKPVIDYAWVSL